MSASYLIRLLALVLSLHAALCVQANVRENDAAMAARLEVDTGASRLTAWSADGRLLGEFENISIGSGGISPVHFEGDESTPLGEYRVLEINHDSRFDIFIALDYPTAVHAELAYSQSRISVADYQRILAASYRGLAPPGDTALGGQIGIHGLGDASRVIHERINWTDGCVALTNEQIRQLQRMVGVGTVVVIGP